MENQGQVFTSPEQRILFLSGELNSETAGTLVFEMLRLEEEDNEKAEGERKPIKLYINSEGGNSYDMWGLIDRMLSCKTPVHTYCTGYARSAAFKIFLAGSRRFISRHSNLMYHQIAAGTEGKYLDMFADVEEMERQQKYIEKYVMERTKIPKERLLEVREKKIDWYITPEEAAVLGIATDFIG